MTCYTIRINEEQRVALLDVLKTLKIKTDDPLDYWVEMLDELPTIEAQDPGILHGFCL